MASVHQIDKKAVFLHPSGPGDGKRKPPSQTGDRIFGALVRTAGLFVLALLGAIILMLFIGGLPAFRAFGLEFLVSSAWNPPHNVYGALVAIYGTIITSVISLVIAVPIAFGIAVYLTELAPQWLRRPVGIAIELLAAVPSIIYGMWGFFIIVPFMTKVQPSIISFFGSLADAEENVAVLGPVTGWLADRFAGPAYGNGILTASLILALMIVPFIAATMRDVFATVPGIFKESAYGLGCTTWEVVRSVVVPYTRVSVVGGIMLGLGRALGETMAVTFVIGNTNRIATSIFGPGNTIASLVALQFPESNPGGLQFSSLFALGFILFVISFIVLATSRFLMRSRSAGAARA
ncbi:Phosphate transport system permease protein pstC [Granulibacter bethesdensis]|nr:Phosphate transport system permease protein pstC [Granulibacter bethesdensis]